MVRFKNGKLNLRGTMRAAALATFARWAREVVS